MGRDLEDDPWLNDPRLDPFRFCRINVSVFLALQYGSQGGITDLEEIENSK